MSLFDVKLSEQIGDKGGFVQCHRGIAVNIKYIENYDKTSKYIKIVGRQVAVGRAYQSRLEMILGKQQFMQL